MHHVIKILLVLLNFSMFAFAQVNNVKDSLLAELNLITDDTLRIRKELDFAGDYYLNNTEMAQFYTSKALSESIAINYELGIADAYNLNGIISQHLGEFEKARELFKKALEIYLRIDKHRGIVNCYNNIGLAFSNQSNYIDALEFYFKAMKYLEKHPIDDLNVLIYSNAANLYYNIDLLDESEVYLKRAENIAERIANKSNLIYLYNLHGSLLESMKKKDSSMIYYTKSLDLARELNNSLMISATLRNIGSNYLIDDTSTAIRYFDESLGALDNFDNSIERIRTLNQITYMYYYHGEYNKALRYALNTMDNSKKIDFREGLKNSALYLSYIYGELSNYKDAYDYRLVYDSINSNFYKNNSIQSVSNLFQTLEYERREYDLQLGLRERTIRNLILMIIASALFILFFIQRNLTKRAKRKHESLTRELTSNAMILAKQNEVFSKIDNILNDNKHRFTKENQVTIQEIINKIRLNQNEESWNSFEAYFNKVHKNFHKNLDTSFPSLSVNERRLCSLLRMNMTTKEISSITQQTAHSINIARGRLRKKLGLANQKTSIYTFLAKY